jgi:predicted alternative tryptophan synthase beta-subunit
MLTTELSSWLSPLSFLSLQLKLECILYLCSIVFKKDTSRKGLLEDRISRDTESPSRCSLEFVFSKFPVLSKVLVLFQS